RPWAAIIQNFLRFRDHLAFDAAARNGAFEAPIRGYGELSSHRDGRRAPGIDHGRQRDPPVSLQPIARRAQHADTSRSGMNLSRIRHFLLPPVATFLVTEHAPDGS